MKEIFIAAEDSVGAIKEKIIKVFPGMSSVCILSVTTGSDVMVADFPEDQSLFGQQCFNWWTVEVPYITTKYGHVYISFTMNEVHKLCKWVTEAREKILKGLKSAFKS